MIGYNRSGQVTDDRRYYMIVDITGRETRQSENLRIPEGVIGIRRRTIRFSGVSLNNFFHNKISYKYSINSYKFQLKEYLLSGSSLPLIPK